jgi:hypothetical protein
LLDVEDCRGEIIWSLNFILWPSAAAWTASPCQRCHFATIWSLRASDLDIVPITFLTIKI